MRPLAAHVPDSKVDTRRAGLADLDALLELELQAFQTDRVSRRSLRNFLRSPHAALIVAETGGKLAGYALVLFRPRSIHARLYSLAVVLDGAGRGIGRLLLAAAEAAALEHGCLMMRLEVRETNERAITLYRRSGYRQFGHHHEYYEDKAHALRFEKRLVPRSPQRAGAPAYVHQTTDFTCGPACALMALAWADPDFRPTPVTELTLWREATTILSDDGPGGCEPYGLAVTLARRGLSLDVWVSRPGPYFIADQDSADKRRVMELTQADYRAQADALGIRTHLNPVDESSLMAALDDGCVAILLVSGYHLIPRGMPHWVFAFGRDGHCVHVHDPAAIRDEHGDAKEAETYAVPWPAFERVIRMGRDGLSAMLVIRKGPSR